MKIKRFLLFLFFLNIIFFSHAQNSDSTLVRIETSDGNEFVGKIIGENALQVVLSTTNLGEITIQKKDIKSQVLISQKQIKEGKLWFVNPQATRYFWAPNGYGLKRGEGYYQNIYVLYNQVSVGVTDNFSVGGVLIPLFLFAGGPTPLFVIPKFSIPIQNNKLNLGVGALVGTIVGEETGAVGLLYGLSTFGSPDNNVSIGLAYGFADGDWASSPLINISGLFRISSRGYFITENYFIDSGGVIAMGGRWIIKKASLDFMFGVPLGIEGGLVIIPALGFTIPFTSK